MDDVSPNPEFLAKLEAELTNDLLERLVAYCDMKAKRRPWYGLLLASRSSRLSMAEGHEPGDIVNVAITKTLEAAIKGPGKHRRVWDGRRDLYDHLTSVIDSELSNLGKGWVNKHFQRADQLSGVTEEGDKESFLDGSADDAAVTPEEVVLSDEVEAQADAFVCGFIDLIGEDSFLFAVVQEILDGARKPADIAKTLNVKVEEVYKVRKRLQRLLENYRATHTDKEEVGHG